MVNDLQQQPPPSHLFPNSLSRQILQVLLKACQVLRKKDKYILQLHDQAYLDNTWNSQQGSPVVLKM